MSVHIYFANNSIRNTTLSCDSLGIHYTISKPGRILNVSRWDSKTDSNVVIGEFELPFFRKDRIRIGPNGEWQLMRDYFDRNSSLTSHALSFTANNGMKYTWKTHWNKLSMTHHGADEALVTYHRNGSEPSYLEVSDTSVMSGLDIIILAFIIAERKRRNRQKRRRYAAASGGGGGG